METPPAGWYQHDDQPTLERYWDGSQWLAHVRPVESLISVEYGAAHDDDEEGGHGDLTAETHLTPRLESDVKPQSFSDLQERMRAVLDQLTPERARIISMLYGLDDGQPKSDEEISDVCGVTPEQIRQIESRTKSKIRHPSRAQVLPDYLD